MKKTTSIMLVALIIFAVILNFLPHLHYRIPLHVDEWVHFQYANHLSNGAPLYFGQEYGNNLESGFHFLLATLNALGVPYLFMFTFFASFITILICLGVFILARQIFSEKAGLFAVLFIALLKSTVAILGPMFLVPMAIGMFFIAIIIYLIKIKYNAWFLLLAAILIIHPPTAMAILLLINLEFFIINRKDLKKNLSLELLAGLIALPLYLDIFMSKGLETVDSLAFAQIINAIFIPRFLGWISIIIIVIGIFYSIEEKKYFIIADIIGLLIFIFMFYRLEINVFIPYARALMYLFVIFAVVFGYGCEKIIGFSKNKKIRIIMAIALTALLLFLLLPKKIDSMGPIYHIINEQEYKDFTWIKDNTNKNAIVLIDPWKADAFTPIAERAVYSRIVQGPSEKYAKMNEEIAKFFSNNCTDTSFLENNNITIIYGNCNSSDLEEIHPKVYSLPHPFQSESAS